MDTVMANLACQFCKWSLRKIVLNFSACCYTSSYLLVNQMFHRFTENSFHFAKFGGYAENILFPN